MTIGNSVIIVASPRPRVGKTLLARLLLDYHLHEGRAVRGYDLNIDDGSLAQFQPELASASGVANVQAQMALFDALVAADGVAKVVDVGHEGYKAFFELAYHIGFAEEAHRRGIAPVILFMISADGESAEAYRDLGSRFPRATLAPVHNEMLGPAQYRGKFPTAGRAAGLLRFPALAPGLRKYIETPPFSFAQERLANASNVPLDVHIELQRWLRKIYLEFREFDLRVLLADLQASIRL